VTLDGGSSWVNTTLYSSLPVPGGLAAQGVLNSYLAGVTCPSARACFCDGRGPEEVAGVRVLHDMAVLDSRCGRTWTEARLDH